MPAPQNRFCAAFSGPAPSNWEADERRDWQNRFLRQDIQSLRHHHMRAELEPRTAHSPAPAGETKSRSHHPRRLTMLEVGYSYHQFCLDIRVKYGRRPVLKIRTFEIKKIRTRPVRELSRRDQSNCCLRAWFSNSATFRAFSFRFRRTRYVSTVRALNFKSNATSLVVLPCAIERRTSCSRPLS